MKFKKVALCLIQKKLNDDFKNTIVEPEYIDIYTTSFIVTQFDLTEIFHEITTSLFIENAKTIKIHYL